MKNIIVCKNCGTENPYYGLTCVDCKSYIRDRIYNVDLWKVLGLLIEDPRKGFQLIIQSEHKNFISFILIFAAIKFSIDSIYLTMFSIKPEPELANFIKNYLIVLSGVSLLPLLFGIILKYTNGLFQAETRIRDNFSTLVYSFVPQVFALILLFIVEATVFGGNIFSKNPSPFILKEFLAYTLLVFEILVVLWGMFLSITAIYTQVKNIIYSITAGLIFNFSIYYFLYLISLNLYN